MTYFERPAQIISKFWTKIAHNLIGLLGSIKGNMHHAELKRLEFHVVWDIGVFYRRLSDRVEWVYLAP